MLRSSQLPTRQPQYPSRSPRTKRLHKPSLSRLHTEVHTSKSGDDRKNHAAHRQPLLMPSILHRRAAKNCLLGQSLPRKTANLWSTGDREGGTQVGGVATVRFQLRNNVLCSAAGTAASGEICIQPIVKTSASYLRSGLTLSAITSHVRVFVPIADIPPSTRSPVGAQYIDGGIVGRAPWPS